MPIHENAMSSAFSPLEHSGEDTSGDRNYKGSINDMYGDIEEWCGHAEKKRRLSFDQVRRLERHFEMENKVEPERKMQLAKELGLQPRQVAVWFQNRRARWKTKQLEKDYDALKFNYVNLKSNYEELQKQKEQLSSELEILKRKFVEDKRCKENSIDDTESGKNETYGLFSSENSTSALKGVRSEDINFRPVSGVVCFSKRAGLFPSSDSDSSTIVNQDRSSYCPLTTGLNWDAQTSNLKIVLANTAADCRPDHGEMQFSEGTVCCKGIPPLESQQLLILDEGILHNEGCNLFTNVVEDQSTTLPWWGWP